MKREIIFWDEAGAEVLQCTDKDEAIENILDGLDITEGELEICGYARMEHVGLGLDAELIVETLIERWDEEYGGDDSTDITEEMIVLGNKFVNKMSRLYEIWQCEIVHREKIDIRKWVEVNRPDWLIKEGGELV